MNGVKNFLNLMQGILQEERNVSVTENGALGYRTTGKELLDMNFAVASMRNMDEEQIVNKFVKVFYENKRLAVKWLFYASDVREGLGERRLFRILLQYLAENHAEIAEAVLHLVPEYNRWDNLWCLLDTALADDVTALVEKQLQEDMRNCLENKSVSLLAKWMPSVNASSAQTKRYARILMQKLDMNNAEYRKVLARLREYMKVIEVSMSKGEWEEIVYEHVPSKANLLYKEAFLRHDKERRETYLKSLQSGETTIHSQVLFPQDIVHKYYEGVGYRTQLKGTDVTLEELWKALPDYVQGDGKTLCVVDGSGSMTRVVGNTGVSCLQVAHALGIYFAERCDKELRDKFITFSMHPQFVDLSKGKTLREKLEIASAYTEVANTNIEAVFTLLLQTAVKAHLKQADMPENILILSDMEFDGCARFGGDNVRPDEKLFATIAKRYAQYGYKLPRLVFWNIAGRTGTIPVKENPLGVALVSGFSPAAMKLVLSNRTDPFECLLEELNSERYDAVEEAIAGLTDE
ncbi:MAG: DUF2828 family protein [Lachnospiraceae bacterium]|nr:DUF2828 family protein [Lachnospiraceae bacterium]